MSTLVTALSIMGTLANSTPNIPEHFGYYIYNQNEYYSLEPYRKWEFGFNKLNAIKYTQVEDNGNIKLHIYQKDWAPTKSEFFAMDLDLVHHDFGHKLNPQIKEISPNRFEVNFPNLNKNQVLFVRDFTGNYAISLTEPVERLISVFENTNAEPHVALGNIKDALKSYPESTELQELKNQWQVKYDQAAMEDAWQRVETEFAKYQEAPQDRKSFIADELKHQIRIYSSLPLSDKYADKAQSILSMIEQNEKTAELLKKSKPFEAPEAVSDLVEIYKGDNLVVTITKITNTDDVLIRVLGSGNDYDGKVYRHTRKWQNESNGSFIYHSEEIENGWNTFIVENDGWGGNSIKSFPPGVDQAVHLRRDMDSAAEASEKLLHDYILRNNS